MPTCTWCVTRFSGEIGDCISHVQAIYDACDDDKSGGVSMAEYAQLFDRKIDDEMKKMYEMIDGIQHDGVLSKTEARGCTEPPTRSRRPARGLTRVRDLTPSLVPRAVRRFPHGEV